MHSLGAPSPRESNGAVVLDGKMFVFGGYSGVQWLNDLHAFDLGITTYNLGFRVYGLRLRV